MRNIEKLVNGNIEVTIDYQLKYDGHRTILIQPDDKSEIFNPDRMSPLQKALVQGFQFRDAIENGKVANISELAHREKMERASLFRTLSLVNLAPDIIEAILKGTEPPTVTVTLLRRGFPDDWNEQRTFFGMK